MPVEPSVNGMPKGAASNCADIAFNEKITAKLKIVVNERIKGL